MKVCHVTSVHESSDNRIFLKECSSLARAGYNTYLVARGESFQKNNVTVVGCGEDNGGRLSRMLHFSKKVYKTALSLDCDIYHFHDPELLRYAVKIKKLGKLVIFDSHEDVPSDIISKEWIPSFLRGPVAKIYGYFEKKWTRQLDAVVTATEHIAGIFKDSGCFAEAITNYPLLEEYPRTLPDWVDREDCVCYVGAITRIRGIEEIVKAAALAGVPLLLAGSFETESLYDQISSMPEFSNVEYLGYLSRDQVQRIYSRAKAGLIILYPEKNHITAMPNKLFEYMAAGIPVIASDFPLWREMICGGEDCGVCVDPQNLIQMAGAIKSLINDPQLGKNMGLSGRSKVEQRYNWGIEEKKLLALYKTIIEKGNSR